MKVFRDKYGIPWPSEPVFINLQYSHLGTAGFPVEIGWVDPTWSADGKLELTLKSLLIKPENDWLVNGTWDPHEEAIHGISLVNLLKYGTPLPDLKTALNADFSDRAILSTKTDFQEDAFWLKKIYGQQSLETIGWTFLPYSAIDLVNARALALDIDRDLFLPSLMNQGPKLTHAAAEDALSAAWLWSVVELMGKALSKDPDAAAAILQDDSLLRFSKASRFRPRRRVAPSGRPGLPIWGEE
jgi:hypothetical protein